MKKLAFLLVVVISSILVSWLPNQNDYTGSFSLVSSEWGEQCGTKESFHVEFRNNSSETMDLQVAVQKTNGKWDVGLQFNMRPGEKFGRYTCYATGKYKIWARPSNSNLRFPSQTEIDNKN